LLYAESAFNSIEQATFDVVVSKSRDDRGSNASASWIGAGKNPASLELQSFPKMKLLAIEGRMAAWHSCLRPAPVSMGKPSSQHAVYFVFSQVIPL
jgi:hypothetical protein